MNFCKAIAIKKVRQIQLVNGMKGLVNGKIHSTPVSRVSHWAAGNSHLT